MIILELIRRAFGLTAILVGVGLLCGLGYFLFTGRNPVLLNFKKGVSPVPFIILLIIFIIVGQRMLRGTKSKEKDVEQNSSDNHTTTP